MVNQAILTDLAVADDRARAERPRLFLSALRAQVGEVCLDAPPRRLGRANALGGQNIAGRM